jgi:hypothetical protein
MDLPASGRRNVWGRFSFPLISPPEDVEDTQEAGLEVVLLPVAGLLECQCQEAYASD